MHVLLQKKCNFCNLYKPSSRSIKIIDNDFICCFICKHKILTKFCRVCGHYTLTYSSNNSCILCQNSITFENPIR